MTALFLSIAAFLGWGVADFIAGLKSRSLAPLAVMILATPFGIMIIAAIVLFGAVSHHHLPRTCCGLCSPD